MVDEALGAIEEVDAALLVIDVDVADAGRRPARARLGDRRAAILAQLRRGAASPVVLAINKVDTLKARRCCCRCSRAGTERAASRAIVPISATKGTASTDLVSELCALLPAGPPLYAPEMLTDRTERFLAGELIREQLFLRLRQELPYATAVVIDDWEEREDRATSSSTPPSRRARQPEGRSSLGKGGR